MGYSASVLAHSSHPGVPDLVTVVVRYPRRVLAEVVTHRLCRDALGHYEETAWAERTSPEDFSKNTASSRAIPVEKMIQAVLDDPYVPERFSKAGPGMQGHGWLEGEAHVRAARAWLAARDAAVAQARVLLAAGVHKQDANRLLEPFAWTTQILTADTSGWANYFAQRCHKDADPAYQKVARLAYLAVRASTPVELGIGEWHLPFVPIPAAGPVVWYPTPGLDPADINPTVRVSVARCAWVSYENHEKDATQEAADRTFARLVGSTPLHASPCEHQATPSPAGVHGGSGNYRGWMQLRKFLKGERATEYNPSPEEVASWGLGN